MKALTCEMCGSQNVMKEDGVFVCQACGTKYSVEEAKKMMIEGTVEVEGTVKLDNSSFVEKYLANARRACEKEDWEEVEKYYNMVEQNTANNMEAVFFSAFGKAMLAMFDDDYYKRAQKFKVLEKSISVINDYFENTNEDKQAVLEKINNAIKKMASVNYIYNPNLPMGIGGKLWMEKLLTSIRQAFISELQQIAEKHEDEYIQTLLTELNTLETNQSSNKPSVFVVIGAITIILAIVGIILEIIGI